MENNTKKNIYFETLTQKKGKKENHNQSVIKGYEKEPLKSYTLKWSPKTSRHSFLGRVANYISVRQGQGEAE